jgi:hypothetical protein
MIHDSSPFWFNPLFPLVMLEPRQLRLPVETADRHGNVGFLSLHGDPIPILMGDFA